MWRKISPGPFFIDTLVVMLNIAMTAIRKSHRLVVERNWRSVQSQRQMNPVRRRLESDFHRDPCLFPQNLE